MKKLEKLNLKAGKILSQEELVNFRGGGSCAYIDASGESGYCDLSPIEAEFMAEGGGHWCCDSCETSSWHQSLCG